MIKNDANGEMRGEGEGGGGLHKKSVVIVYSTGNVFHTGQNSLKFSSAFNNQRTSV